MEINFSQKGHSKSTSNFPFVDNLKKLACASRGDGLVLTTLWYLIVQAPFLTNKHLKSLVKARAAMFVQQVSLTSSTMFLPHTCLFAIYELNYPEAITALGCNKNKEFPLYYYVLYTL